MAFTDGVWILACPSMSWNAGKALHISKKRIPSDCWSYRLGSEYLECVPFIKYLGIVISCDLQWGRYTKEMVSKANRELGLVKQVCRDITDISTQKLLFCSLVLPHLEYCSSSWSPSTVKHRALVKNVQRRATKFILNYPPREDSYPDRLHENYRPFAAKISQRAEGSNTAI
jgi:hypothetical protein